MTTATDTTSFVSALCAAERSPEVPENADIYGRFLGSWEIDVFDYEPDGTARTRRGEVHFARVLEGRAVQLVWIIPGRSVRGLGTEKAGNRYGTTLCIWDASIAAWRATWFNPVSGARNEMIARGVGAEIVQVGRHADGRPTRWNFSEIAPTAFRWTGEALQPDGRTWILEVEFRATRTVR